MSTAEPSEGEGATARGLLERLGMFAFYVTLVLVGVLSWKLQFTSDLDVDASALASLPDRLGPWRSVEVPMNPAVEAELDADLNLQRVYRLATGEYVWLYIGYYGTSRGGRPEHTPRNCYVSADWGIEESAVVDVAPAIGLRATEYLIERNGERRLVQYWYRSHRRTGMLGGFDQALDRLLGRLVEGRADGALVRVSAPVDDADVAGTRARLLGFAPTLDRMVAERWPLEIAAD